MFNWVFNQFYFLWASPEVWGVSVVAILDSSVNCTRMVDKKVNYAGLLCCREL